MLTVVQILEKANSLCISMCYLVIILLIMLIIEIPYICQQILIIVDIIFHLSSKSNYYSLVIFSYSKK
jgi:hypothetical protein